MLWIISWTRGWITGYGLIYLWVHILNHIYKEFDYFVDTRILSTIL